MGDLETLHGWLRLEPALRGRIGSIASGPAAGELGGWSDVLTVTLGSGGTLSVLAASLRVFFSQPRGSDVVITVSRGPEGRVVKIDAKRVQGVDIEQMVRQALEQDE